jgi:tetratricopeptide (TPR) repeat protein
MLNEESGTKPAVETASRGVAAREYRIKGNEAMRCGDAGLALEFYTEAVRLDPENPENQMALAHLHYDQFRYEEAAAVLRDVLRLRPEALQAWINLGAALHGARQLEPAVEAYQQALRIDPESAMACANLGLVYQDLEKLDDAACMQLRALALDSTMASAHNNLGSVLLEKGEVSGALACFRRALRLKPHFADACFNVGFVHLERCEMAEAERCFEQALALQPDSDMFRFYIGELRLQQGRFPQGWQGYEHRWNSWQLREVKRVYQQPQWRGEPLEGKKILLFSEQGLGDTLQFVRYAPMVAALGGRVLLEVQPRLRRLFEGMEGIEALSSPGEALPEFDWQCPLMSLPLAFQTTLDSIPNSVPYVHARPEEAAAWASRLSQEKLRVGVVWSGNRKHSRERSRSVPLPLLAELTSVAGTSFYSLQMGDAAMSLQKLPAGHGIADLEAEQTDMAVTAAIIANLDLVITIDTSVAHLAGAMGKPVWILLHHSPDWRWLMERRDSPWYPSARLFRKGYGESWQTLLLRVRAELERLTLCRRQEALRMISPAYSGAARPMVFSPRA